MTSNQKATTTDSKFITIPFEGTDGLELHYLDNGAATESDSKTFVLLHGSVFNSFTWNKVMDIFAARGRVIAYDQIPYGLSEKLVSGDWTETNPYSSEAAIEQLFTFIDMLDLNNVVLVGNSYGATLAVRAAATQPELFDALILVDAAVYVQEEMPGWLLSLPQVQRMGPLMARAIGTSQAFIRQTYLNPGKISDERMELTTIHSRIENWDMALWEYLSVWKTPGLSIEIENIDLP